MPLVYFVNLLRTSVIMADSSSYLSGFGWDAPSEVPTDPELFEQYFWMLLRLITPGQGILIVDAANFFTRMASECVARTHVPPEARSDVFQRDLEVEAVQQGVDALRLRAQTEGFGMFVFVMRPCSTIHPDVLELPSHVQPNCTPLYTMFRGHQENLREDHGINAHVLTVHSLQQRLLDDFTRRSLDDIATMWIYQELNARIEGSAVIASGDGYAQFQYCEGIAAPDVTVTDHNLITGDLHEIGVVCEMRVWAPRGSRRAASAVRREIVTSCYHMHCDIGHVPVTRPVHRPVALSNSRCKLETRWQTESAGADDSMDEDFGAEEFVADMECSEF